MNIFIVGEDGAEHNHIHSVHRTYKGALNEWNRIRQELLAEAQMYKEQ